MQENHYVNFNAQGIIDAFSKLNDNRVKGRCLYRLIDIIFITICAILCGAKHWSEIEEFGKQRLNWLKKFLPTLEEIPSHQTFCRIFYFIPAAELMACFIDWNISNNSLQQYDFIAIDGKTIKKSDNISKNQKPLHLINAYATNSGIILGAIKTPDKTNEIKDIPRLLKLLQIAGCIITIDAIGTQKGIANLIIQKGAHYILALKKNHKRFYKKVNNIFIRAKELNYQAMVYQETITYDYDHSRYEKREYKVLPLMYFSFEKDQWNALQTIIQVKSIRDVGSKKEESIRYYLSSLSLQNFMLIVQGIRQHWHVENKLHWKLDVVMQEDVCRIHDPYAAENFSTMRKLVLQILENDKSVKKGLHLNNGKLH